MGTLLIFILKYAVCLIMFYLFYKLTMSKETFHSFNRFALLGLFVFAGIIPAAEIPGQESEVAIAPSAVIEEAMISYETVNIADNINTDNNSIENFIFWIYIIYFAGIVFFLIRNICSFVKILRITGNGKHEDINRYLPDTSSDVKLTVTENSITPFSWMNHIVISRKDLNENGMEILRHEMAHIRKLHSIDLIIADICILLQWFNPAAWLMKTELQNVHEFEADESVINNGIDAKNYQLLLIKKAVGSRLYSIANSFNHSKLKKRITMMMKKKSNPWARAKYLYVLPLAAVAVAAFARPEVSELSNEISSVKVSDFSAITKNHEAENSYSVSEKIVLVEGTVIDGVNGKGLPGVSVIERGSTNGTITDKDGHFRLRTTENSVIVISYIGKQTYSFIASDMEIKELKNTPIRLKDHVQRMDEIVVVGYEPDEKTQEQKPQQKKIKEDEEVFIVVEQMPEFPGGMSEFMKYIARNIKYPVIAQEAKIEGRVIVQFIVGTDGYTSNFEIIHSVCPSLDAEAIRVLAQMPKWKPGMQRGVPVPVKYTVPVTFRLEKKQPEAKTAVKDKPTYSNQTIPVLNVVPNKELEKLLIVINDKVATPEDFNSLKPGEIESISAIKDSDTNKLYKVFGVTEKKEGIILIKTKAASANNAVSIKIDDMTDKTTVDAIKDKLRGDAQDINVKVQ